MSNVIKIPDHGFNLEKPANDEDAGLLQQTAERVLDTEAQRAKANLTADVMQSVRSNVRQQRCDVGVVTADMSTEERSRWQSLLLTLSRYGASRRFGELLRSYGFNLSTTALKRLDLDELEDVLDRVRVCCQQSTVESMFSQAALSAVGFVESAVCATPTLKDKVLISGLTEGLRQDESFMSALEQLSIDMGSFVACPPEYRLMMAFVAAAGRTHAVNLFMKKRKDMIARSGGAPATKEEAVAEEKESDEGSGEEEKQEEEK